MVQAVENWGVLTGTLRDLREQRAGRLELDVEVAQVDAVEGFPNFLAGSAGEVLTVTVGAPAVTRSGLRVGDLVRVRAQRTGPRTVVGQPGSLTLLHRGH